MKVKNILLIIFIIIIVMIIALGFKIYKINKNNGNNLESNNNTKTIELDFKDNNMVKSYEEFFAVNNAFTKYINYSFKQDAKAFFSILDKNYVEKNNITEENVIDKIGQIDKSEIIIKEMYYKEQNDYNTSYLVKAYLYDYNEKEYDLAYSGELERDYKKVAAYVIVDKYDSTFSIIPTKYE